ncbi:hypothetical protein [Roseicella frigidaeris]|uniref:Cadherin domain-containing protein n=1 Tax=Roseicella frigidaeris TaxID=2230885 RepID=A0A327M9A2_9PROT|nr:hypothetical protein [Roseicella frigidaeris]RAI59901.1 hypothetical protein DOO78_06555 [Roseicella frigidaeris]
MVRSLLVSGLLPASLTEGSGPLDWAGTLSLAGDLDGLVAVEVTGPDALAFSASLLTGLNAVWIAPAAAVDFEALLAAGRDPVLSFGLRFTYDDGSVLDDPTPRSVTVLDSDDTPPTGLAFAEGGRVAAGAIGAAIGTLAVSDPDSTGPFSFSFPADEAWRFEVAGNALRLRPGISLGLDDMPQRPLIIEVSDGHQSAAFTLQIRVTDPAMQGAELQPGESRAGFSYAASDTAIALRESRTVAAIEQPVPGEPQLTLAEGPQLVLPGATRLQFLDGHQDIGAASSGLQAASLVQALTGHAADATLLAALVTQAEAGRPWVEVIAGLPGLAALPAADAEAIAALYHNTIGRAPAASELGEELARLAAGESRAQLVVDLALGEEALAHQPAAGVWVADGLGADAGWRGGTGGLGGTVSAAAASDAPWLL